MTREEAVNWFEAYMMDYHDPMEIPDDLPYEVAELALSALRPVSREQLERVWTGCPACKNGPPKLHIPAFRAMAICNQHMDHEAFDIELNGRFCLNCGRPLTPKAWEELRKRWEALKDE